MAALDVCLRQQRPIALDVAFSCQAGELLALVGPSGSGKTTILRVLAGLAQCAEATVRVGPTTWVDTQRGLWLAPQQRRVGLVFQEYALFPHLSALRNVMVASARADAQAHASELLARVRLDGLGQRLPAQLSGGQRQRVALARALAREPLALLLDEPFSAVDQATREQLYVELAELRRELAVPLVLVTHDLHEAQRLADRLVVLDGGTALAVGPVDEVLARPEVARRMPGVDAGSVLHCRVDRHDERFGLTVLAIDAAARLWVPRVALAAGTLVRVRVPARDIALARTAPQDMSTLNRLPARIESLAPLDATHVDVLLCLDSGARLRARITAEAAQRLALERGQAVWCLIKSVALDPATLLLAVERTTSAPAAAS